LKNQQIRYQAKFPLYSIVQESSTSFLYISQTEKKKHNRLEQNTKIQPLKGEDYFQLLLEQPVIKLSFGKWDKTSRKQDNRFIFLDLQFYVFLQNFGESVFFALYFPIRKIFYPNLKSGFAPFHASPREIRVFLNAICTCYGQEPRAFGSKNLNQPAFIPKTGRLERGRKIHTFKVQQPVLL
jgi:hypothetical protein